MIRYLWFRVRRKQLRSLGEHYSPLVGTAKNAAGITEANVAGSAAGGGGNNWAVLQKCKSTFYNMSNRNPFQVTGVINADIKSSHTTPMVATPEPAAGSATAVGETSCAKYRFGALFWRSSKGYRKKKPNNSIDSGIEIEFTQDEQQCFPLPASGQQGAMAVLTDMPSTMAAKESSTCCSRSSTLEEQVTKKSSHRITDRDSDIALVSPKSLTLQSFSHPHGLDTFGISRTDIEEAASDNVVSHKQASSYCHIYAEVLYDFAAAGPQELDLARGTVIEILRKQSGPWWLGRTEKEHAGLEELGWFPNDFVRIIPSRELLEFVQAQKKMLCDKPPVPGQTPVPVVRELSNDSANMAMQQGNSGGAVIEPLPPLLRNNCDTLRHGAVRELLESEINYVKLLGAICDRYLPVMSQHIDIFPPSSMRLIFSNITAIYEFQQIFLKALRRGIEQNQVSKVFLQMGFLCYSTYCNAYSRALIELESRERLKEARTILDNCNKNGNLVELPLSAHLLAPVQRICRYPLHLTQLVKTALNSNGSAPDTHDSGLQADVSAFEQIDVSQFDIPDTYDTVNVALNQMRCIAEAVNEGKRHSELIARHQESFQCFKGPPLHLHSTRFFHQVDAMRQKQNLWNSSCTLFLFDNQLVYCKRDVIKRSRFFYKGRIYLDRVRVVNIEDGTAFGHTIKSSLRIYCTWRDKWYDFSFRSTVRKQIFLNALAQERQFGGKALYVDMYDTRPGGASDQSDNELPNNAHALPTTSASGDSPAPDSSARLPYRCCDTLYITRDSIASTSHGTEQMLPTTSTGPLGRRRLSNWFRKPKGSRPGCGYNADTAIERIRASDSAQQEPDTSFA